jgi:hypothetical protein
MLNIFSPGGLCVMPFHKEKLSFLFKGKSFKISSRKKIGSARLMGWGGHPPRPPRVTFTTVIYRGVPHPSRPLKKKYPINSKNILWLKKFKLLQKNAMQKFLLGASRRGATKRLHGKKYQKHPD